METRQRVQEPPCRCRFNLVASRSAQAAVIKAIKAGKANVDLSTPTTPGDGFDGGGSNPSGDNKGAPLLPKS
nr:hypothetical protein [uncultured Prevotella sp.]